LNQAVYAINYMYISVYHQVGCVMPKADCHQISLE